ncbi:MAG: NAD(P)/FAD-dependent oxidoreductase [Thermoleophilia bacterium]|nr:NAD(P)/FAD-dependent oxidoreductase [Thermoleophilia bacterium]
MPGGVVVLGAGVAGESFVATLRRLDRDVAITIVERELVGGECSYWACIPSKTMLRPLEVAYRARSAPGSAAELELASVLAWRDEVAEKDDASQVGWLEGLDADVVRGRAEVVEPGRVRVGERDLPYEALVVATGSVPATPPMRGLEEVAYWTSREGTSAKEIPESLAIVGGGAVGCELAQFYARAGSRVTLVQSGETLLERIDEDAGSVLGAALESEGVRVLTGTRPTAVQRVGERLRLECEGARATEVDATHLLVATGRRPNVEGLGLERLGLELGRGGIAVDDGLRAGQDVWAVGDVTGISLFTHVGKYQARVAAENVAGGQRRADYRAIPAAVFTDPQVASVGDTSGDGSVAATWDIAKVSRASTYAKPKRPGFVKLFAHPERAVLVGAVAVGPEAGEWVGQLTLAVRAAVPVAVLRDTIQPFPTFSEAVYFAARELPV